MRPPEDPEVLVFFVDANLLGVAKSLEAVRNDILYPGHTSCPTIVPATPDSKWLAEAGRRQWIVILRDKRVRSRSREREALLQHGLRTFCLTGSGNASSWDSLRLLAIHWPDIERVARESPGPFIYSVTREGVKPLTLGRPAVRKRRPPRQGMLPIRVPPQ